MPKRRQTKVSLRAISKRASRAITRRALKAKARGRPRKKANELGEEGSQNRSTGANVQQGGKI